MESLYGPGLDPTPFFAFAFGLAALALAGFFAWTVQERRKLRQLLAAVRSKEV